MQIPESAPFTEDQKSALNLVLPSMSPAQLQWLTGFVAGVEAALKQPSLPAATAAGAPVMETLALGQVVAPVAPAAPNGALPPVTIIYGSESGNAEGLAHDARKEAVKRGLKVTVKDMAETSAADLNQTGNLLVITSTWGDGDPPDNAIELHAAIMSPNAPSFEGVNYAVCALGDTSYDKFCQTGKDFDVRLDELGGNRLSPRVDCDLDYEAPFQEWLGQTLSELAQKNPAPATDPNGAVTSPAPAVAPAPEAMPAPASTPYGKKNPFPARLTEKILLSGRGSGKETWHYEFSLAGSGLTYEPGDSLALIPQNARADVEAVLEAGHFLRGSVTVDGGSQVSLGAALASFYDCTTLTKNVLTKYQAFASSKKLETILGDSDALREYLHGRQIVDMLQDYPVKELTAEDFIGILRRVPPRLYSIASSLRVHPDEVHLTVASVRYHSHGRDRTGVASTFLADRLEVDDTAPAYLTRNKHFKLPQDPSTPIIMVGPGTGIAPFRAFIEERQATGATGKNWLVFGDQRYTTDFLYQLEWQDYLKDGVLTRLDVAFSRDQKHKIYVQNRMEEQGAELWQWLQDGAIFYVCGDASRMAGDVHDMLIQIGRKHGGLTKARAGEYVENLRKQKRYLRDVY